MPHPDFLGRITPGQAMHAKVPTFVIKPVTAQPAPKSQPTDEKLFPLLAEQMDPVNPPRASFAERESSPSGSEGEPDEAQRAAETALEKQSTAVVNQNWEIARTALQKNSILKTLNRKQARTRKSMLMEARRLEEEARRAEEAARILQERRQRGSIIRVPRLIDNRVPILRQNVFAHDSRQVAQMRKLRHVAEEQEKVRAATMVQINFRYRKWQKRREAAMKIQRMIRGWRGRRFRVILFRAQNAVKIQRNIRRFLVMSRLIKTTSFMARAAKTRAYKNFKAKKQQQRKKHQEEAIKQVQKEADIKEQRRQKRETVARPSPAKAKIPQAPLPKAADTNIPGVTTKEVVGALAALNKVAARAHREKLKQRMERRAQLEQFYKECEETTRRTTAVNAWREKLEKEQRVRRAHAEKELARAERNAYAWGEALREMRAERADRASAVLAVVEKDYYGFSPTEAGLARRPIGGKLVPKFRYAYGSAPPQSPRAALQSERTSFKPVVPA